MNLSEAEKRMIYQVEGTSQGAALNEIYMTWRYAPDKAMKDTAEGLLKKLRPLSDKECMDVIRDVQKNYRLPGKARTIGEMLAEARQQSGAQKMTGHDIMALERFDPDTRHMIVFDVLSHESPMGYKGDKMRLFLTEAGYGKALENQDKGFIKIKNHAKVIAGNLRYCRLSQDDKQEGDSNSIINQKKILKKYAMDRGYTNIQFYIDDGISGTTFNRAGFQSMIADVESGKVKRVIVKDMSRLGRDYLQVGMYTEIFFPEHDVHFIAVNDGVDSNQEDNEFTPFRNIINEWYAKDTSKKIRAVKRSKGMAGEHIGSHPPYGYRKNPENKKEWIVDEEAAEVVREIFRLCVSGYGPTQIANMLTEREILCPTYYALERGEKPRTVLPPHKYAWNGPVVAMILDRVDYLGHTVNFKTHNKSYKCHKKIKHTPDQWKVFEDTHEAIIDKETFEIVQKIRAGKRRPTRMGEMPMFSGLLYCADCGSKLTFHRKADEPAEKHHYICGNYRSNTSNCTMHYIRNVVVERIVLENLKEVIRYVSNYEDEFVRMVMDADVRQKNRELAQKKKKLIELQKRIGELDTIFQRIYEDNITGKLSDERFMKMSKGYEDEQHTLQAEADKIQNELQQEEKKSVDVKRFLAIVKKYTDLTELTPEILREFVDKIIVHAPDKSSGRRLQEIEIIYNHIGEFDHSKVTLWKGNAV